MFKCAVTGRLSQPNEKAHKLVTHVRNVVYARHNPKSDQDEVIGHGSEIVHEVMVCREVAVNMEINGFKPAIVDND